MSSLSARPGASVRVADPRACRPNASKVARICASFMSEPWPGSFPTLKVDKYKLGIATTAVPFAEARIDTGNAKGAMAMANGQHIEALLSNAGIEYWLAVDNEAAGSL